MAKGTLFNKVWEKHRVTTLASGMDQILIGLHLIHEVTSPQAFSMLKEKNIKVAYPNRTFATMDHIVPTERVQRPYQDTQAELMAKTLEKNAKDNGITLFDRESNKQGIVHIIGPERGLTQPGMTIACGDSHTSTHGAFGSLAFGIGTTEVRNVLATQSLSLNPLKVRQILVEGELNKGVYAKDVILKIIADLGVKGGIGYAYEYGGSAIHAMSMEERMTICNMSIEGGARIGYVNPDEVTYSYIKGRDYAPKGEKWDQSMQYWESIKSDADAEYDDVVRINAKDIMPMVTWGINPEQALGVQEKLPSPENTPEHLRLITEEAYDHMKLKPGSTIMGTPIQVAFIGSCTNGRISDLRLAASVFKGRKVKAGVKALIVPGSLEVKQKAEEEGLDKIFIEAGAEWRDAGCSMCLAMNPDKLVGDQISASSSNRNFIGRQGSKTGRTLLMSPAMVAAAAINGEVSDVRDFL